MADLPPSRTRIVPIMAGRKYASGPSSSGSRSLRRRALKGETMDREALRLQCLEELRLYAAPIKGDGNCLFYSLADQLYGSPDRHDEIRAQLVQHVRTNPEYFMQFVTDVGGERRAPRRAAAAHSKTAANVGRIATKDGQRAKFEAMLSQMGRSGSWGGSVEIQAFCQAYERDVLVYTEYGIQTFTSNITESDPDREVAHLAYHSFEHYSSVRSVDGPHAGLPALPRPSGNSLNKRETVNCGKLGNGVKDEGSVPPSTAGPSTNSVTLAEPWKITTIAEALPGFDRGTIRTMLTRCRGDIDNAFARLLDDETSSSQSSQTSSSRPNQNSTSSTMGSMSRTGVGSSSRSSSRHSAASKRSADHSDDDEGGSIRPAIRRHRGRDRKRRILQDVTVGISVRGEDENDVISIRLRVDPNAVAEQAEGVAAEPASSEEELSATERQMSQEADDGTEGTVSSNDKGTSDGSDSEYEDT